MSFLKNLWRRAGGLAEATPSERNRYVDFLRAASILVVILGHWLVAAPYLSEQGELVPGHMLEIAPWTQWLTLVVQVMPIFFLVGGYANAVAWASAQKAGTPYGEWLAARFRRLIGPVIPVLLVWIGIALAALGFGLSPESVGVLSQAALVPTWFLAVYVMVGVLVPWTHAAWNRFGFGSFAGLVAGAALVDIVAFSQDLHGLRYLNYGFVWLAIHQLGYAWRDGRFRNRLAWAGAGAAALAALVIFGPYPLAMVGVPGSEISNTSSPTLALLALGVAQSGLILRLEGFARRILDHKAVWTATVLLNGMIMSLYLWHMTVMIIAYGLLYLAQGSLLSMIPNTAVWWQTRPIFMLGFFALLLAALPLVSRFERPAKTEAAASGRRLVTGASMVCVGLALISELGVAGANGLRITPTLLPLVGTGIAGFGPFARLAGYGQN
ncbi:MAG: acyltransferase [Myxococcota bacterium]